MYLFSVSRLFFAVFFCPGGYNSEIPITMALEFSHITWSDRKPYVKIFIEGSHLSIVDLKLFKNTFYVKVKNEYGQHKDKKLELYQEINALIMQQAGPRLEFTLYKLVERRWERLTQTKIDFESWIDEDEEKKNTTDSVAAPHYDKVKDDPPFNKMSLFLGNKTYILEDNPRALNERRIGEGSSSRAFLRTYRNKPAEAVKVYYSANNLDEPTRIELIMPYCEVTLEHIINPGRIKQPRTTAVVESIIKKGYGWILIKDMLNALIYLNGKILHRDIKPGNIFIMMEKNNTLCTKLGDFGLARMLNITSKKDVVDDENEEYNDSGDENSVNSVNSEESEGNTLTKDIGTEGYMAPEVRDGEDYSYKADIYSMGRVFMEYYQQVVFPDRITKDSNFLREYPVIELFYNMISGDPCDRKTAEALFEEFEPLFANKLDCW
uniref:Protein kinase domain-containing protein n=1 Tax=Panagrolaimus davidi TaxID=227884 RepID=A0A914QCD2_9BILA